MEPLSILGLVLAFVAVNGLTVVWFFRRLKHKVGQRVEALQKRFSHRLRLIAPTAAVVGMESKDYGAKGGGGTLALTDDELVFQLWMSGKEILIPRHRITAVREVNSFAGKSMFKPLLQIEWKGLEGHPEALALYAPQLETLRTQLQPRP